MAHVVESLCDPAVADPLETVARWNWLDQDRRPFEDRTPRGVPYSYDRGASCDDDVCQPEHEPSTSDSETDESLPDNEDDDAVDWWACET